MPTGLNKAPLKASIKAAIVANRSNTTDPAGADDALAGAIADAIDVYVKNAIIVYTSGLSNSGGVCVGTFVGNLS